MLSDSLLRLEHVTMQFGGVVAVNDLSLEVNPGEIVALIGPNGAGKTTAFNCITGVYQPTGGKIFFENEAYISTNPVIDPTPDQVTQMGIARTFQNIRLWKSMTVFDNVLTAKHMHAKHNVFSATFRLSHAEEKRMREETAALLEEQNLLQYKDDLATSLPYGLQRRLEIARALAADPKLLLLDEPAAGMNPQETQELGEFIVQIKEKHNLPVLMIEHHMDLVMQFSDRIYVIDFGRLISSGTPEQVQADQKVIDAYLGVSDNE